MLITPAELNWIENDQPFSIQYQDIYFSRSDALAETRYVFLKPNRLPERFQKQIDCRIFELGFGTGLNFLTTWQAWDQTLCPRAQLHYLSVEKNPLQPQDIIKALAPWQELRAYGERLLQHYPPIEFGRFDLKLTKGVTLTLLFGDANLWLPQIHEKIDAWYLDGFAPKYNPELWQESLFKEMARLSMNGSTFSTFSAAGSVRRDLQVAGFHVHKCKGFGAKREMLRGCWGSEAAVWP